MRHQEVPEILIEQYALGELSPEKARKVEQSPRFAERIAEIERSNAEILAKYPSEQFASRIENQYAAEENRRKTVQPRRRPVMRWVAIGLPSAAAVIVGVLLAVQGFVGGGAGGDAADLAEVVRIKGAPALTIYRSVDGPDTRDDTAEQLDNLSIANAGDRLQLEYNAGDRLFGAIVSVDGRGAVYTHFPLDLSSEPELVVGRDQQLAYGYQLDDAPEFEHFFFVTSQESFDVRQLVQDIRSQVGSISARADSLELDGRFEITSVTIRKGE